jgi:hypothetical protein
MSSADQPSHEHQVGITNAHEQNPDAEIRRLTAAMNALFAAKQYAEAARIALSITALSKDELRETFERHGVTILHLDHEAFGIYAGVIEPSYDLRVDGRTPEVLAAATEFGARHAQEAVLIARKLPEGETDPAERLGLSIVLNTAMTIEEAVEIVETVRDCGFQGATFAPKRAGEVSIYHTDDLGMTREQFDAAGRQVAGALRADYPQLRLNVQKFIIQMPTL